ncbi:uncharacterized protein APUU_80242S [Aspergillus puulaauensis]|uniref:Uncharacterized protein n=1 Tax=Aspergillus puulaauensis TaxID=1220207 RepID=A0A7R7Y0J6_9EURO|nr:uncharacterized protein APUU_80242S [Aspergillus puulaauensis]BCS29939.1 hypothetical protein APUU_80242S [Aspergillus puulaauensis]
MWWLCDAVDRGSPNAAKEELLLSSSTVQVSNQLRLFLSLALLFAFAPFPFFPKLHSLAVLSSCPPVGDPPSARINRIASSPSPWIPSFSSTSVPPRDAHRR